MKIRFVTSTTPNIYAITPVLEFLTEPGSFWGEKPRSRAASFRWLCFGIGIEIITGR